MSERLDALKVMTALSGTRHVIVRGDVLKDYGYSLVEDASTRSGPVLRKLLRNIPDQQLRLPTSEIELMTALSRLNVCGPKRFTYIPEDDVTVIEEVQT